MEAPNPITGSDPDGIMTASLEGTVPLPLPNGRTGSVNRVELVRLLADGLRDLGYVGAARELEKESGTTASSVTANNFLTLLSQRKYDTALTLLDELPFKDGARGRKRAKNFIVQERYLDALMNDRVDEALTRLQQEVYFLKHEEDSDMDELAALLACPTFNDLTRVSNRLRARQAKRFRREGKESEEEPMTVIVSKEDPKEETSLIDCIRGLLDADAVVPPSRLPQLLGQSIAYQWSTADPEQASSTHSYKRFDLSEPLPLLRQLRDVEDHRNASYTPGRICRQVVYVSANEPGGATEIWCTCFHPTSTKLAAGTSEGTVILYTVDPLMYTLTELGRVRELSGRNRPITSLDWVRDGNNDDFGFLLCTLKQQTSNARRARRQSSDDEEMDEDEGENAESDDSEYDEQGGGVGALVRPINVETVISSIPSSTLEKILDLGAFPSFADVFHDGRPCAKWIASKRSIATAGPDGWYKLWRLNETDSNYVCSSTVRVERVVDMAVAVTNHRHLVLLACADSRIQIFDGTRPIMTIPTGDSIVSIGAGFNTVIASVRWQQFCAWNLNELKTASPPALIFRAFVNKRFVLRPSVGFGDFVAIGSEDGTVHVWSTTGNLSKEAVVLKGHVGAVNDARFSPVFPGLLVSAGDDGTLRVWSKRTEQDDLVEGIRL